MASRIPLRLQASRPLVFRNKITHARTFADKNPGFDPPAGWAGRLAEEGEATGPNMEQLPHVSEEAAAMAKTTGGQGPDLNQGTKIEEKAKEDKELQDSLPQVMKDQMKKEAAGKGQVRGFSTLVRSRMQSSVGSVRGARGFSSVAAGRRQQMDVNTGRADSSSIFEDAAQRFSNSASFYDTARNQEEEDEFDDDEGEFEWEADEDELEGGLVSKPGLKFEPVTIPLGPGSQLRKRYETIVDQVTKLLMRDGKLSAAQRNMSTILTHLRTSPPPHASSKHPLIPGAPPHSRLSLEPTVYLSSAIDSVAPVFRIRSQRGAAGGGVALQIPVPLKQRQRRRTAVMWMLDAVEKRRGGTSDFAKRFAEEVVSIVEGKSSLWARREALHGLGIRARANLAQMAKVSGRR